MLSITATDRTRMERKNGARYSELLRLRYFDVIRFHVVDPMHNLFLGIPKHTTETCLTSLIKGPHFFDLHEKFAPDLALLRLMNGKFGYFLIPYII